jgi:hypothetical protein
VDETVDVWEFIKENPKIIGISLSENKGLDLLSALRDVYETNKTNHDGAQTLLTLLANVLVASAQGDGEAIVEEVIVQDAMMDIDNTLKGILNEGQ